MLTTMSLPPGLETHLQAPGIYRNLPLRSHSLSIPKLQRLAKNEKTKESHDMEGRIINLFFCLLKSGNYHIILQCAIEVTSENY